jgi:hypothetical protein
MPPSSSGHELRYSWLTLASQELAFIVRGAVGDVRRPYWLASAPPDDVARDQAHANPADSRGDIAQAAATRHERLEVLISLDVQDLRSDIVLIDIEVHRLVILSENDAADPSQAGHRQPEVDYRLR